MVNPVYIGLHHVSNILSYTSMLVTYTIFPQKDILSKANIYGLAI